ncbi:MAG TPA: hypothetical protein VHL11_21225 [Phototrophicaceae bacterium]|nr:hypothetical protein [Phototrophicaceae bacterium]
MKSQIEQQYSQASLVTADNLRTIAKTLMLQELSRLSLPEIEEAVDIVGKMVPAGNVPGMILNGLARISGRRPPGNNVRRDINLLFKGVEQVLDHAAYGAFFAGPAAVIWGYQNLLKLAGKQPEDAFPQGTWQFYVDYALREDTARHTNETHGFNTVLSANGINPTSVDRITALFMSCITVLQDYPLLLENEWRERVYAGVIETITQKRVYGEWEKQRPYGRRADAGNLTYVQYRRTKFDEFIRDILKSLSTSELEHWQKEVAELEREQLPAYQQQMSILSYLKPESHNEDHIGISLEEICIGIIYHGSYYLIPAGSTDVMTVRNNIAALLEGKVHVAPAKLTRVVSVKRSSLNNLERQLNTSIRETWDALRHAPILINIDQSSRELPLLNYDKLNAALAIML